MKRPSASTGTTRLTSSSDAYADVVAVPLGTQLASRRTTEEHLGDPARLGRGPCVDGGVGLRGPAPVEAGHQRTRPEQVLNAGAQRPVRPALATCHDRDGALQRVDPPGDGCRVADARCEDGGPGLVGDGRAGRAVWRGQYHGRPGGEAAQAKRGEALPRGVRIVGERPPDEARELPGRIVAPAIGIDDDAARDGGLHRRGEAEHVDHDNGLRARADLGGAHRPPLEADVVAVLAVPALLHAPSEADRRARRADGQPGAALRATRYTSTGPLPLETSLTSMRSPGGGRVGTNRNGQKPV